MPGRMIADPHETRSMDILAFLACVSTMSLGTWDEKASLLFDLVDFDGSGRISFEDAVIALRAALKGILILTGTAVQAPDSVPEALANEAFRYFCCDTFVSPFFFSRNGS